MTTPTPHQPDGGPAFPVRRIYRDSQGIDHEVVETGMSQRDWFAGQALMGLIPAYTEAYGSPTSNIDEIVGEAYRFADAMLATREGGAS